MPKNYYLVLGLASDASFADIKEAYRRLAKAFHPDHYGENQSPFLEIHEAYSVLSDPVLRQTHDLSLKKKLKHQPAGRPLRTRTYAEPLIPEPFTEKRPRPSHFRAGPSLYRYGFPGLGLSVWFRINRR